MADELITAIRDQLKEGTANIIQQEVIEPIKQQINAFLAELGSTSNVFSSEFKQGIFAEDTIQDLRKNVIPTLFKNISQQKGRNFQFFNVMSNVFISSIQKDVRQLPELLKQLESQELLAKQGLELINNIANQINNYELQYEITFPVSDDTGAYTFLVPFSTFQQFLHLQGGQFHLQFEGIKFWQSSIKNVEFINILQQMQNKGAIINQDYLISYQAYKNRIMAENPGLGGAGGRAVEAIRKMAYVQLDKGDVLTEEEALSPDELNENLAMYRGPDYWIQLQNQFVAVQSKLFNATINIRMIENALGRIIILLNGLETVIQPYIDQNMKTLPDVTRKLLENLVDSVFGTLD